MPQLFKDSEIDTRYEHGAILAYANEMAKIHNNNAAEWVDKCTKFVEKYIKYHEKNRYEFTLKPNFETEIAEI
jgi:hypothetical protein